MRPVLIAALALGLAGAAQADGTTTSGDCTLAAWSGNRNLDEQGALGSAGCTLQLRQTWTPAWRGTAALRLGQAQRGGADRGDAEWREAVLDGQQGAWSLRLGRQLLAWGRADRINPTDLLSSRDATRLVPQDEDQRRGTDALLLRHELGEGLSISAVLARFRPHRLPQGALPVDRTEAALPRGAQGALRLERSGADVDWALTLFDGHAMAPTWTAGPSGPGRVHFESRHDPQRALGADVATTAGRFSLRGEAAWIDVGGALPHRQFRWVLGADTDVGESANLNVQLQGLTRSGYRTPADADLLGLALDRLNGRFGHHEPGLTLRWSERWWNDRLQLELAALFDLGRHSHALRPRLRYSLGDDTRLVLGADLLSGPAQSVYGSRRANRVLFVEFGATF